MAEVISAVTYIDNIMQVKLSNVMKHPIYVAKVFAIISEQKVNIDMISQVMLEEEMQIAFTCTEEEQEQLQLAIKQLKKQYPQIEILQNRKVSKICVEGEGMAHETGVATKIFTIFAENNVPFYQVTTSTTSISYIIDKEKRDLVINKIKQEYQK